MVLILSKGDMVYYGQADNMVEYFTSLGHPCPQLTNPCDFYGMDQYFIYSFKDLFSS